MASGTKPNYKTLKPYSSKLRKTSTEAEIILWSHIRKKQILNVQFYRQKIIGPFIVDFYAAKLKLVIEIDGSQHYHTDGLKKDIERDRLLQSIHLTVLRYSNYQVMAELSHVLDSIYGHILRLS